MKQASATHLPCTDGGTEERIHPAYQKKIEKQEEKIASASNAIVKQCGEKIMTQLVEEVKIRLS